MKGVYKDAFKGVYLTNMLSQAKNYDVMCFQLWKSYSQLDSSDQKEVDKLVLAVRQLVSRNVDVSSYIDKSLSLTFDLRMKAILSSENIDITLLDRTYQEFASWGNDTRFHILADNIMFALRCNRKVIDAIKAQGNFPDENEFKKAVKPNTLTLAQVAEAISLVVPNANNAQQNLDWLHSSLRIEFVIFAALIIYTEKLEASDKIINELAFVVADSAQEYSAIANQLGILKQSTPRLYSQEMIVDTNFVAEQQQLADLGLSDFESSFE